MGLRLKNKSVNLDGLSIDLVKAIPFIMQIWSQWGVRDLFITSANDAAHMENSKHFSGNAIDIRSRNIPNCIEMCVEIREALGPDFDVVIESDHVHIEYDP